MYDNALEKAYELWEQIKNASKLSITGSLGKPIQRCNCLFGKSHGWQSMSVVPFEVEMNLDVRVPIQFSTAQVIGQITKIIEKYQADKSKGNL